MHEEPGAARQDRIGPYKILDRLGEGGMGTVYLAEQSEPVRRRVALKLIKLGMDSRAIVARFQQERQALALMQHDGIAKVYDCGTTERGQPYFVMELVTGVPLTDYCDRGRLTLGQRIRLVQQVCEAVTHAHQKGIVHRDLKPSNVLVTEDQGRTQVKIIDFGLAKAMGHSLVDSMLTEAGQIVGTPEYMAPEQADPTNADVDTRADVYSVGVMLYEVLSGQLPIPPSDLRRAGLLEMQRVLREVEPPKPSTRLNSSPDLAAEAAHRRRTSLVGLRRALVSDLDWLVLKAIEKDRARRYSTANALAADLQRYLDHEPLVAGPPSATYRLRKLVRRYRGQVLAALLVFAALIVGGVATFAQYRRAESEASANAELARTASVARDEATRSAAAAERLHQQARRDSCQSRVAAAQLALRADDAGLAQAMLEHCDADLRGLEWRLLAKMADQSRLRFEAHSGGVLAVATSPDGKWIASIPGRSSPTMGVGTPRDSLVLRIWDALSGAPVAAVQLGQRATALKFTADGEHLWVGGDSVLQRISTGTWSVDATAACSAISSRSLTLADVTSELAFAGSLWHWSQAGRLQQKPAWPNEEVMAIDPTGRRVLTGESRTKTLRLRNRDDSEPVATFQLQSSPSDQAFSRDGSCVLVVDLSGQIARVGVDGEVTTFASPIPIADSAIWLMSGIPCCAMSGDGDVWAVGTPTGALWVWSHDRRNPTALHGHKAAINALAFLPNGDLVSGATDGTVRVWSAALWRRVGPDAASHFLWSPSGDADDVWTADGPSLTLWSRQAASPARPISIPSGWTPALLDGKSGLVLMRNDTGECRLWSADTAEFADGSSTFALGARSLLPLAAELPLAIAVEDPATVVVFDARTGQQRVRVESGLDVIRTACLTADGRNLLVGGGRPADGEPTVAHGIRVFDVATGGLRQRLVGHSSTVTGLATVGEIAASSSLDGTVKVWRPATGEMLADLHGHRDRVYDVMFVDGGDRVLSSGQDGTIRLWDWRRGEETSSIRDCPGWVFKLGVDPAAHTLWAMVFESGSRPRLLSWDCAPR